MPYGATTLNGREIVRALNSCQLRTLTMVQKDVVLERQRLLDYNCCRMRAESFVYFAANGTNHNHDDDDIMET
jgi:hypothetical protein